MPSHRWLVSLFLVVVAGPWPAATAGEARVWTGHTGTVKKTAEFERLDGKWVHLRLADGELLKLPLEWLSDADQAVARDAASRGPAAQAEAGAIEVVIAEVRATVERVAPDPR